MRFSCGRGSTARCPRQPLAAPFTTNTGYAFPTRTVPTQFAPALLILLMPDRCRQSPCAPIRVTRSGLQNWMEPFVSGVVMRLESPLLKVCATAEIRDAAPCP